MSTKISAGRQERKPRSTGLTMVIKGMGLAFYADFLELNWSYVDFIKFSFGTSIVYPEKVLKEKNLD